MTAHERTGWRDEWPSTWHRQLGRDFPMCDVDGLWFDQLQPVAMLDWKHERARWHPLDASLRAQANLAAGFRSTRCQHGLPFLVIRYRPDDTAPAFQAHAMNAPAAAALTATGTIDGTRHGLEYRNLDAAAFVHLAAHLRALTLPATTKAIAAVAIGTSRARSASRDAA